MSPPLAPSLCSPIFSTLFPPLSVTNLSGVSLSFLCFLCKNEQLYVYCPFHSLLSHVVDTYSHFAFFLLNDIPWRSLILKSLLIQISLSTFSFFLHKLLEKLAVCPVEFPTGKSGLCGLHPHGVV